MNEEQLLEFLYIAPVALIKFDEGGNVKMANPRVAQLFNRYAPGGYFANFFQFLDVFLDIHFLITFRIFVKPLDTHLIQHNHPW